MSHHAVEPHRLPLWIAGKPDADDRRDAIELISPVDGSVIALVEQATEADVDAAVVAARDAFVAHRRVPRHQRAAWLLDAANRFEQITDDLTDGLIRGLGKPRRLAAAEARRGGDLLRRCAAELSSLTSEVLPLDAVPGGEGHVGLTMREAHGVVAAITPFNAPINLMLQKLAPAIAMGNAVIVKPSPEAAAVTLRLIEAIAPAFPTGMVSVLCGDVPIATALVRHPMVAAVSLTGSVAAGASVLANAGIKPVMLELGSNAPNLVLSDADVPSAAAAIAAAAFSASGQQCISAQRVVVQNDVAEQFVAQFSAAAAELTTGDPFDAATDIGPVVHRRARDRIVAMIDDAVAKGARLVLDGRTDDLYLRPTIVTDVPGDARLLHEEVFGPVVAVVTVASVDEAIDVANASDLGLQASCFTSSLSNAFSVSEALHTGAVWINEASRFRLDTYPFGGVKNSGLGREGVRYAMEEMSYVKFVGIRPRL